MTTTESLPQILLLTHGGWGQQLCNSLRMVMWALSSKVNPAGDLVQLPNMSVLELDPGSSPAGITDKLIIDATTQVAPDNRGHYSQPVCDLPETKAWAEKLTAMLANRK